MCCLNQASRYFINFDLIPKSYKICPFYVFEIKDESTQLPMRLPHVITWYIRYPVANLAGDPWTFMDMPMQTHNKPSSRSPMFNKSPYSQAAYVLVSINDIQGCIAGRRVCDQKKGAFFPGRALENICKSLKALFDSSVLQVNLVRAFLSGICPDPPYPDIAIESGMFIAPGPAFSNRLQA